MIFVCSNTVNVACCFFPDGAHLVSYRDVCILCVRATLHSADEKMFCLDMWKGGLICGYQLPVHRTIRIIKPGSILRKLCFQRHMESML